MTCETTHELSPDYSNSVYEESKLVEEEPLVKYYQFPSSTTTTTTTTNLIPDMVLFCLLDEMNGPVAFLENARDFLFQKNILRAPSPVLGVTNLCSCLPARPRSLQMD